MSDTHFEHGRAPVSTVDDGPDWTADGGRAAILAGAATLTDWIVWDWTRQIDERLDALAADVYDAAEQAHRLATLVVATMMVFAIALSIVIGVIVL
jgi:hypothetical protein